uniref:Uncharacterized protein n=1 Tax=Cyanothece sp. (strain PCC 7425 / ATCC 29141) TaxID=395961 RepID=B8HKZ9_CYAP4
MHIDNILYEQIIKSQNNIGFFKEPTKRYLLIANQ